MSLIGALTMLSDVFAPLSSTGDAAIVPVFGVEGNLVVGDVVKTLV